ncbi:MAG TPA: hypothetical protein VFP79_02880, partial [Pseudolabrys sp.]|nr:hypothetical protein [Pseudolabrys sp.]
HISGTRGGHTLNLHQFARDGVVLLGRLSGVEDGMIRLAPDLHDNLAAADRSAMDFTKAVDAYVERAGMVVPEEKLPVLDDGFAQPLLRALDLRAAGITNVIWATGYRFDFSMIKLPVLDEDGYPIQTRGVTAYPGLFFVGLPWLHDAKSGLIYGVGADASYIADQIAARRISKATPSTPYQPRPLEERPILGITRTRRRLINAFWSSVLAFIMEGSAVHAAGLTRLSFLPRPPLPVRTVIALVASLLVAPAAADDIRNPWQANGHVAWSSSIASADQCQQRVAVIAADYKFARVNMKAFRPDEPFLTGEDVTRLMSIFLSCNAERKTLFISVSRQSGNASATELFDGLARVFRQSAGG